MRGDTLPDAVVASLDALLGCVAGAVKAVHYLEAMRAAGLTDIVVVSRFVYGEEQLGGFFANGGHGPLSLRERILTGVRALQRLDRRLIILQSRQ